MRTLSVKKVVQMVEKVAEVEAKVTEAAAQISEMQDAVESHHEAHKEHRTEINHVSYRLQSLDDQWNSAGDVLDEAFEVPSTVGPATAAVHLSHLTTSRSNSAASDQHSVARDLASGGSYGRAQTPLGTPADIGPVPEDDDEGFEEASPRAQSAGIQSKSPSSRPSSVLSEQDQKWIEPGPPPTEEEKQAVAAAAAAAAAATTSSAPVTAVTAPAAAPSAAASSTAVAAPTATVSSGVSGGDSVSSRPLSPEPPPIVTYDPPPARRLGATAPRLRTPPLAPRSETSSSGVLFAPAAAAASVAKASVAAEAATAEVEAVKAAITKGGPDVELLQVRAASPTAILARPTAVVRTVLAPLHRMARTDVCCVWGTGAVATRRPRTGAAGRSRERGRGCGRRHRHRSSQAGGDGSQCGQGGGGGRGGHGRGGGRESGGLCRRRQHGVVGTAIGSSR
eukprot:COSAG05_NODE_2878_length_2550_cov_3.736882_2_plen_451_part_00